jgi:hypothetical protein
MALVRCPEGHIFSARRHGRVCPYCNKTVKLDGRAGESGSDDSDGSFDSGAAYLGNLEAIKPVTGWLVCVDGPSKGRDYRIFGGKNFIGRADGMDMQILGDNDIAKRNHAVIAYDPKKRKTMIVPGESHGMVYVDDEAIYTPFELRPFNTVEFGASKFLFVPLCGENFEWTAGSAAPLGGAGLRGSADMDMSGSDAADGYSPFDDEDEADAAAGGGSE